ncbi:hypothetical protein R1flu_010252 [Riccia fluitans]|uniref:Uncharacterized protein n=1 Tax=Riccia fluitans TaxID=41844 RepID=A0ABD1Z591_9MARC
MMDKDYAISSNEPPMTSSEAHDVPMTPDQSSGAPFARSGSGASSEHMAKTNFGKRKRDASQSANVLVEALDRISQRQVEAHIEAEKIKRIQMVRSISGSRV